MNRRDFLKTLSLGVAAAAAPVSVYAASKQPLNVLMIAIDDMNNWIGAFGGKAKTPNIDRLAQQGVLFTNAHCVVSCCNPSRTALFTGQRPETTGQFSNDGNFRLRPGGAERVTLPQHFRQHGYEAVSAGKLYHWDRGNREEPSALSDPQSWNVQRKGWVGTSGAKLYQDENGLAKWHGGKFKGYWGESCFWGPCPEPKEETQDWMNADYCAQYLSQRHDKPFFLACGIFRPHSPQLAPQEFFDMYPLDKIELPEVPADDLDDVPEHARKNFTTDFFLDGIKAMSQWEKAVQGYLASMTFADACVGHLLDALDNSAYADNTVVALWTDHGWQLGHKYRWEKFTLWRQSTHTPLIFKVPGMTKTGERCHRAVSFLDLYPTLAEVCDLPVRPELEGHSLVPLLKKPGRKWKHAAVITDSWETSYSVEYEHWNYIRYADGSEELYDHREDVKEFRNLAGEPQYAALKKKLASFIPTPETNPAWRNHKEEHERSKAMEAGGK